MFYQLVKTVILLGNGGPNAAQKALQVTQIIVYPAFVIVLLVCMHMTVELNMKLKGAPGNSSKHIESVTRIVIDSLVYTACITLWGHTFNKMKSQSLKIFNFLLRVSQHQNQIPLALNELFTVLTIFSIYFDTYFYIVCSTVLLVSNMMMLRLRKPISMDEENQFINEDSIKKLYNKMKKKKIVHIFKKYWKKVLKHYKHVGIPVNVEITPNPDFQQNVLKIVKTSGEEEVLQGKKVIINKSQCTDDEWTEVETESISCSTIICRETIEEDVAQYYLCLVDEQYLLVNY